MYDNKKSKYFKNVRKELLDLIPNENKNGNLLEIGVGEGNTLLYAKENNYAQNIYGVELFKMENSNQTSSQFEEFLIANIEETELPFEDSKFDAILLGDVLEHLINPYTTLNNLKKYLKPNGVVIASIPNIREWKTMKTIFFKGDFKYTDSGILDKTHLRFFTKKNIIELFENNNYKIENIVGSNKGSAMRYLKRLRLFKFFLQVFFEELVSIQYFVVAKK